MSTATKELVTQDLDEERKLRLLKAVKSDHAEIPEYIWFEKINQDRNDDPIPSSILNKLRSVCLKYQKKQVLKSFWKWLKDLAISIDLLNAFLRYCNNTYLTVNSIFVAKRAVEMGAIICMGFTAALIGEQIMLVDLSGLSGYLEDSLNHKIPFVPLTLRVRFKGEIGLRSYMLPLATITNLGIHVELWAKRMLQ